MIEGEKMALTSEERQSLYDVLDRTGAHRTKAKQERVIPEEYRAYMDKVTREEITLDFPGAGAPVKCYISKAKDRKEPCPVFVNMHGGGFIFLQDADDDMFCAHVASEIKGIVVDIDYASSKDHAFPVPFNQCYEVVKWVFTKCKEWDADPSKVAIGGHSAGGCLSAAINIKAAKTGDFKVNMQVLDYAALDNYAPFLTEEQGMAERSRAFSLLYTDGDKELLKDPLVSPAYAKQEDLVNQPRTLIVTAKNCPFCEVDEKFGNDLIKNGTVVTMKRFLNSRHGFTIRMVDEWIEAQQFIIDELKKM